MFQTCQVFIVLRTSESHVLMPLKIIDGRMMKINARLNLSIVHRPCHPTDRLRLHRTTAGADNTFLDNHFLFAFDRA